jgi:hypothetical protein
MTNTDEWFVSWTDPMPVTNLTQLGPFSLDIARVIAASIQATTGQATVIKDAEGNFPT